jgi:hypothetical protein
MSIGVGESREVMRPLDQSGNYTQGARGCHRGHMESLNVKYAKPGFTYYYARTDPSSIERALNRGWVPVRLDDPERMGEEKRADLAAAGLDSTLTRNDIVLCRMPDSRYRELRERLNQLSEGTRGDGSSEYLERGRSLQETHGQGQPVYFKAGGHGYRHIGQNNQ